MLQPRPLVSQSQQALLHCVLAAPQTIPPWLALASPPRPVPAELLEQLEPRRTTVVAQRNAVGAASPGQARQLVRQRRRTEADADAVEQAGTPEALLATPVVQQAGPCPGRQLDTPPPGGMIHRSLHFCAVHNKRYTPIGTPPPAACDAHKKTGARGAGKHESNKGWEIVYSVTQRGRVSMSGCRMSSSCSRVSRPWASTTSATLLPLACASAATRVAAS